jgi:hypothetical protein
MIKFLQRLRPRPYLYNLAAFASIRYYAKGQFVSQDAARLSAHVEASGALVS